MHTLIPWYSIPAENFLVDLARSYPVRGYREGTCLVDANCVTMSYIYVETGVAQYQLGGRALNTVCFVGPGATFGVIPCINPMNNYGRLMAVTSVSARTIPRDAFVHQLESQPADALACLRYVVDKTNQQWKVAGLLLSLNARERFLYFVNSCIAAIPQEPQDGYYTLNPPFSQTQMAEILAINRITLARILRPMRESGLVRTDGPVLRIRHDCLQALAYLRGTIL